MTDLDKVIASLSPVDSQAQLYVPAERQVISYLLFHWVRHPHRMNKHVQYVVLFPKWGSRRLLGVHGFISSPDTGPRCVLIHMALI